MSNRVLLCPGQGAQVVGMGRAWAEASPEARAVFDQADAYLTGRFDAALSSLCFEGPEGVLNRTNTAQPALYVCAVASYRGLLAAWGVTEAEAGIVAAAGLSLGEYTALHLSGAFSFEAGLELVAVRGQAMQDAAEAQASGMLALIGADEARADEVVSAARGGGVLVAANFNAPGQVVLSGDAGAIDRAEAAAGEAGLRSARLPVAGAFHSPIMQPAADRLGEALDAVDISAPRFPVYSNVTTEPHEASAASIRSRLAEQLTSPVRWSDSFSRIIANHPGAALHELAPGKTLAGLARRIDRASKVDSHDVP